MEDCFSPVAVIYLFQMKRHEGKTQETALTGGNYAEIYYGVGSGDDQFPLYFI
jgi:hypothetical protein